MANDSTNKPLTAALEAAYVEGRRSAFRSLLSEIAGELGADSTEGKLAALLAEKLDVVRVLRDVCAQHGDNDWPDDLHLGDVIEKHLARHLDSAAADRLAASYEDRENES